MFQQLFSSESACRRHGDAPFADERERYLQHCAEEGATRATLRMKANELLWLAQHLESDASEGVDMEALQDIVRKRQSVCQGATTARRLVDIARPWLRFLSWWRAPVVEFRFQNELDRYVAWMRDERGLSRLTVERWQAHARIFLQWCEKTDQRLATLQPGDIDRYFVGEGARRWSRVSVSNTASALRAFLRYAAMLGVCDARLAETIRGPRVYRQESVPRGPGWSDVGRILTKTATDELRDIRNRAILMLLAIYGMRSGEVASLRLDQIDWRGRVLRLFRLKRRQRGGLPAPPVRCRGAGPLHRYGCAQRQQATKSRIALGDRARRERRSLLGSDKPADDPVRDTPAVTHYAKLTAKSVPPMIGKRVSPHKFATQRPSISSVPALTSTQSAPGWAMSRWTPRMSTRRSTWR